jgi:hypothetical protein
MQSVPLLARNHCRRAIQNAEVRKPNRDIVCLPGSAVSRRYLDGLIVAAPESGGGIDKRHCPI